MNGYPNDWLALMLLVFLLGMRHGMDADHLATIDGITRSNAALRPRLSRWSGFLFSLGHGLTVIAIAIAVSLSAGHWTTPEWLDAVGGGISIAFLLVLGAWNIHSVLTAPPTAAVSITGLRGRLFPGLKRVGHPFLIALVGALFALSFDTVSQVALFSLTASSMAGAAFCLALGLAFMLGMMVTDGLNGVWSAWLMMRGNRLARAGSRFMGLVVGGLSVLVGLYGLARMLFPAVAGYAEGRELLLGCAVVAVVTLSALAAIILVPEEAPQTSQTSG